MAEHKLSDRLRELRENCPDVSDDKFNTLLDECIAQADAEALERSAPVGQEQPYMVTLHEEAMSRAWVVVGPTDPHEWFRSEEDAKRECDRLNAAFAAGRAHPPKEAPSKAVTVDEIMEVVDGGPMYDFRPDGTTVRLTLYPDRDHDGGFYLSWMEKEERWSTKLGWADVMECLVNEYAPQPIREMLASEMKRSRLTKLLG